MTEGEVPLGWKTANISQIFKNEAETLRGITDHLAHQSAIQSYGVNSSLSRK